MTQLAEVATAADADIRRARRTLVRAVREASRAGMTQQDIAKQIGRSQPEVSRLLHFHGSSPRARRLMASRRELIDRVTQAGGSNLRVFGSVASGTDSDGSDVDLIFDMRRPLGLFELARVERDLAAILGTPVDLVPESALRPGLRERVLAEAVPL